MDILPCAPLRRSSARAGCSQGGDECGALGTSGQQSIALPRDSGNSPSAIGRKTSPRPTIGPRIRTNHSEVEKGQCFGSGSCELCRISQLFTPLRATTSIWSPALPAARTSRCTASLLLPSGWAFAQQEGQRCRPGGTCFAFVGLPPLPSVGHLVQSSRSSSVARSPSTSADAA